MADLLEVKRPKPPADSISSHFSSEGPTGSDPRIPRLRIHAGDSPNQALRFTFLLHAFLAFQIRRLMRWSTQFVGIAGVFATWFAPAACWSAEPVTPAKPKPAALRISGYGFFGNRELKRILRTLELGGKKPELFSSSFIEDASSILVSRIKRDGYLNPIIDIKLGLADGTQLKTDAQELIETPLPRGLRIVAAQFKVHKGVLYYFQTLEFHGLTIVSPKAARAYFFETEFLFSSKEARAYTPERLRRGLSSLTDVLDRAGYHEAKAESAILRQDDRTGAVNISIDVHEGRKFIIHSIRKEFVGGPETNQTETITPNRPYSRIWLQDFTLSIKTNLYHSGYPDTTVDLQTLPVSGSQSETQKDLVAVIKTGPQERSH
jgi:outer membrane protein assembly factor BamA